MYICNQFIAKESYFFDLPFRLPTYTLWQKPFWGSILFSSTYLRFHKIFLVLYWNKRYINILWKTDEQKQEYFYKKGLTPSWTQIKINLYCWYFLIPLFHLFASNYMICSASNYWGLEFVVPFSICSRSEVITKKSSNDNFFV